MSYIIDIKRIYIITERKNELTMLTTKVRLTAGIALTLALLMAKMPVLADQPEGKANKKAQPEKEVAKVEAEEKKDSQDSTDCPGNDQKAAPEEPAKLFDVSFDYNCKYIFRGMVLNEDPVLQTKVGIESNGLAICAWGNMDTTNVNGNEYDITELNYVLKYRADLSDLDIKLPFYKVSALTVGAIHYDYQHTNIASTTEAFWAVELKGLLNPSLTMYHDVDKASGTYSVLGFGHSFDKFTQKKMNLNLGLDFGMGSSHYNDYYWGLHDEKVTDMNASISFPFKNHGWTITPTIIYSRLLGNSIQGTKMYDQDSDHWYGGISFSLNF